MKHVGVDKKVTREEARAIERRLESLGELWVKCMGVGEAHGEKNMGRVRKAFTTKAGAIPPLYTMQKDHKPKVEGEEWPPSRPVCGASNAFSQFPGASRSLLGPSEARKVRARCQSPSIIEHCARTLKAQGALRSHSGGLGRAILDNVDEIRTDG